MKEAIRKERHKNQMETRKALNKMRSGGGAATGSAGTAEGRPLSMSQKLGMFPPLNVKGSNLHLIEPRKPSELALSDVQKVRKGGVIVVVVILVEPNSDYWTESSRSAGRRSPTA